MYLRKRERRARLRTHAEYATQFASEALREAAETPGTGHGALEMSDRELETIRNMHKLTWMDVADNTVKYLAPVIVTALAIAVIFVIVEFVLTVHP